MGVWRVVLAGMLLVSAAGCTGDAGTRAPAKPEDPVIVTTGSDWSFYPEMGVAGELSVGDDGCMHLGGFVVVWPFGSAWDTEADALVFADDTAAPLSNGGSFVGAGGSIPLRIWRKQLDPAATTALEECLDAAGTTSALFAYPEV